MGLNRPLRIVIFAYEASPTVTENIVPRARERGHDVQVVRLEGADLHAPDSIDTTFSGADVVYHRTSGASPMTSYIVCERVRLSGIPSVNCVRDVSPLIARKSFETYVASQAGLLVPKTIVRQIASFADIAAVLGAPFVAKIDDSSRGRDVHLVHDEAAFAALPQPERMNRYLYQEYVPHPWDYRVHIVGGRAVAMYKRIPKNGDFRANVSQGGAMASVEDTMRAELARLAETVAPHFMLDVCAIDFLSGEDGRLYFAEVNDNPGWEASDQTATGVDLTGVTLDHFEAIAGARA